MLTSSPVPSHIHLPRTFPTGPVPVPTPPLTIVHMKCYQGHKRVVASANKYNPVPCMVCKHEEYDRRWSCPFCALRICGSCKAEFDRRGRDLEVIIGWPQKLKEEEENGWKDGEDKWKENRVNPYQEPDKMRIKKSERHSHGELLGGSYKVHGYLASTFDTLQELSAAALELLLGRILEAQHIYYNAHARIIEY